MDWDPPGKLEPTFLVMKMTALEIQSIVASGSVLKIKTPKGRIFLDHLDYLNATKFSVPRAENRQNAHLETDARQAQ